MQDSWTCIMVRKGPGLLPEEVQAVLKMAACDLHLNRWDRMNIIHDVCEGVIETEWKTFTVGTRTGILFSTHINDEDDEYQVNFLLNVRDLEAGAKILRGMVERGQEVWGIVETKIPVPELYQFRDLRRSAKRMLN